MNGALYPMMAAFRWMVEEDEASVNYRWRGGFDSVARLFRATAPELMSMTTQTVLLVWDTTCNAVGKS